MYVGRAQRHKTQTRGFDRSVSSGPVSAVTSADDLPTGPRRPVGRSRRAEPTWRADLVANRIQLRRIRTQEAARLSEQAQLVRAALDVGATVASICRALEISRTAFYDRYGEMLRRLKEGDGED